MGKYNAKANQKIIDINNNNEYHLSKIVVGKSRRRLLFLKNNFIKDKKMKEKNKSGMRELSEKEALSVNGGFLGLIVMVAATILGGCATMPKRPEKDHYHNKDR